MQGGAYQTEIRTQGAIVQNINQKWARCVLFSRETRGSSAGKCGAELGVYAFAARRWNAGAKTSSANCSSDVGVVFFSERVSSGASNPSFAPFHISTTIAAELFGNPMLASADSSSINGICTYARFGLPMARPTIAAQSRIV